MKMQQSQMVSHLCEHPSEVCVQSTGNGYMVTALDHALDGIILETQRGNIRRFKTADSALRVAYEIIRATGSLETGITVFMDGI